MSFFNTQFGGRVMFFRIHFVLKGHMFSNSKFFGSLHSTKLPSLLSDRNAITAKRANLRGTEYNAASDDSSLVKQQSV